MAFSYALDYGAHRLGIDLVGEELQLSLDGVVRKRRRADGVDCIYVWTNVELDWEEHHFIEGRWWPSSGRILLTSNGKTLLDAQAGQKAL